MALNASPAIVQIVCWALFCFFSNSCASAQGGCAEILLHLGVGWMAFLYTCYLDRVPVECGSE